MVHEIAAVTLSRNLQNWPPAAGNLKGSVPPRRRVAVPENECIRFFLTARVVAPTDDPFAVAFIVPRWAKDPSDAMRRRSRGGRRAGRGQRRFVFSPSLADTYFLARQPCRGSTRAAPGERLAARIGWISSWR